MNDIDKYLDDLKEDTLELIQKYNHDPSHRKLTPINDYGDTSGKLRIYWALWSDDALSTFQIGFFYDGNTLRPVGSKESIPLEEAINNFKKQLSDIPVKHIK